MFVGFRRVWAIAVLAGFGAAAVYVLKDIPPSHILLFLVLFAVAIGFIVLLAWASEALERRRKRLFPPPPLWRKPRPFSALFEAELFAALEPRLGRLAEDQRASLWEDRETGQLWSAYDWDFEFTTDRRFEPIARREDWHGASSRPTEKGQV